MSATVLFHVILARESLVALGADGILLASVFLRVASGVARGGEELIAVILFGDGTRVLVLLLRWFRRGDGLRVSLLLLLLLQLLLLQLLLLLVKDSRLTLLLKHGRTLRCRWKRVLARRVCENRVSRFVELVLHGSSIVEERVRSHDARPRRVVEVERLGRGGGGRILVQMGKVSKVRVRWCCGCRGRSGDT